MSATHRLDRNTPSTRLVIALTLCLALTASPWAAAQSVNSENTLRLDEGAASPPASIEDLAWLAGYWQGEGLGGECEEMWGPPIGDRMLGYFSLRKEGKLVFSEAMALVERDGSLALLVKHFTPEFVGWEEKEDFVTFPMVRLGENEVHFSGLTLRRTGDLLTVFLVISRGGERSEESFQFERRPL